MTRERKRRRGSQKKKGAAAHLHRRCNLSADPELLLASFAGGPLEGAEAVPGRSSASGWRLSPSANCGSQGQQRKHQQQPLSEGFIAGEGGVIKQQQGIDRASAVSRVVRDDGSGSISSSYEYCRRAS